ncbi:TPR Domain containing protein [Trichomonas vaginalis G3]|uniref:TPR Domain containing protein n=1 Tax=Trichomonas vaginalis (strain ATCC PRA-98 / G3) TaxID=412133 RepID=A2ES35_TRIV3|nr:protein ubiquitination [Trichomonas vaginalis G3]EAY04547.1 TPR Domain containing protein [Trichomonas vaginalis G3]KAI5508495.1 protein ubiquitination [Trichomonas vaginalis G3]|eukprot:XP_001316770.1 TPR Domain containing protein [Trichomonas vaginalis G3]
MSDEVFSPKFEDLMQLSSIGLNNSLSFWSDIHNPSNLEYLIAKANSFVNQKRFVDAIQLIESVKPENITNEQAKITFYEVLLESYYELNKFDMISGILNSQQFNEIEKSLKLNILAGKCYLRIDQTQGMGNGAFPFFFTAYSQFPYSIDIIDYLIALGFTDFQEYPGNDLFNQYVEARKNIYFCKYKAAKDILFELDKKFPKCRPILVQLCICCHMMKDDRGLELFVSQLPWNELEIIDLRADFLKSQGKEEELSNLVVDALNYNPQSANAWLAFSHLQEMKRDSNRALHITSHAINLDPKSYRAYFRQGELRFSKGDINSVKKAKESFLKAHQIHAEIYTYDALVHCEMFIGNTEAATVLSLEACQKFSDKNTPEGSMALTILAIAQGRVKPNESLELLRTALKCDGENMEALGRLVDCHCESQQFEMAIQLLQEFSDCKSIFFIYYKFAEVYTYMKQYEKALEYIDKALSLRPNNDRATELKSHIIQMIELNEEDDVGGARFIL